MSKSEYCFMMYLLYFFNSTHAATGPGDSIPPVISGCPSDIIEILPFGTNAVGTTVNWIEPTATDNSGM